MKREERSQLLRILHARKDAIASDWRKAIAGTGLSPYTAAETQAQMVDMTEQVISALLAEPFERSEAREIGAALVRLRYTQPEALGSTQQALAQELVEALPPGWVSALRPRLVALLGEIATGFCAELREMIFAEQEYIRRALIRERDRAEADLRRAEIGLSFTGQERALLQMLARGWDNARIAKELEISDQTVRNYAFRIYRKLGVHSRAEAVIWAREHELGGD